MLFRLQRTRVALPLLGITLLPFATTQAADTIWNVETGLYSLGSNWNTGNAPTSADDAIIQDGGTAQIQAGDAVTGQRLRLRNGSVTQSGGSLTLSNEFRIGADGATNNGTYTATGGSIIATNARIGEGGGTGSVSLTNATYSYPGTGGFSTWIGNGNGSKGTLSLAGSSTWSTRGQYIVVAREGSQGTLNMSGTSKIEQLNDGGRGIHIGDGNGVVPATTATATMTDSSLMESSGWIIVGKGKNATGTLTTSGNTIVTATNGFTVGTDTGDISGGGTMATGYLNMSGNSQAINNGGRYFQIGGSEGGAGAGGIQTGKGTVTLTDSARLFSATRVYVGTGAGSTGTLTISGNAEAIADNGWFAIGRQGATATVTVSGNGKLEKRGATGNHIMVGDHTGSNGTLTISGNATVSSNSDVVLGGSAGSFGTLHLNGGTITANKIREGSGTGTLNFNGGTVRAGAASTDFFEAFESEDINLLAGGLTFDTNGNAVTISQALAGVGGLTKLNAGALTLSSLNLAYEGDTRIDGGTLTINTIFLADTSNVYLSGSGVFDLNFTGADTINQLFVNGVAQGAGTWGAIGSGADHERAFFTGDGLLLVAVPEPSHYAMGVAILLGFAILQRRRARA